jgi:hypothetical protein
LPQQKIQGLSLCFIRAKEIFVGADHRTIVLLNKDNNHYYFQKGGRTASSVA